MKFEHGTFNSSKLMCKISQFPQVKSLQSHWLSESIARMYLFTTRQKDRSLYRTQENTDGREFRLDNGQSTEGLSSVKVSWHAHPLSFQAAALDVPVSRELSTPCALRRQGSSPSKIKLKLFLSIISMTILLNKQLKMTI